MALILPRRKAGALDISELFSTDLYSGNSSSEQTITNGVDLSGEGGLVWIKARNSAQNNVLIDSNRTLSNNLVSNNTDAEYSGFSVKSFNSDGFTLWDGNTVSNFTGNTYAAWTFRKSPSFFDVVTYTGNGTAGRTISHNLGVTPGMIVVKKTDTTGGAASDWYVYHRSNTAEPETDNLLLNSTAATSDNAGVWNDTAPSDTDFTVGGSSDVNVSGGSFVAYLFAHDTTDNGVIQCGSYTGNGSSSGPTVTLGWEPQWVMIKRATGGTGSWYIWDSARDGTNPRSAFLYPNQSAAEATGVDMDFTSTGFQIKDSGTEVNPSGSTVIYVAIRAEGV